MEARAGKLVTLEGVWRQCLVEPFVPSSKTEYNININSVRDVGCVFFQGIIYTVTLPSWSELFSLIHG